MFAIDSSLFSLLANVYSVLTSQNLRAYVVGGFLRDRLLGRETADVDLAVNGDALRLAQKVAAAVDGYYVLLNEANAIARVVVTIGGKPYCLDFTSFEGKIENDLLRRDFTVDAIAIELRDLLAGTFQFVDRLSGRLDLEAKLVRAISNHIFEDDATRLFRAVRLAAELGFKIEPKTETLLRQNCGLAARVPGEKLREELLKLLAVHGSSFWLRYLDRLGLLDVIMPELTMMKSVEQPIEHCWDVFEHSLETVATVEFMLRESRLEYASGGILADTLWAKDIEQHFDEEVSRGSRRRQLLKLAGLLHDIAKPLTKTTEETGKVRFLGHAKEGAAMSKMILRRLRFSSKEIKLVENLIYHHLRPAQMSNGGLPSSRAIYRYFRDTGDACLDVLFLALADYLATRGPQLDSGEWQQHNKLISYVYNEHLSQQVKTSPVKLIGGHDIMGILGLSPGPIIGQLLAEVREAQAAGEVNTKEDAIALVKKLAASRHCRTAC